MEAEDDSEIPFAAVRGPFAGRAGYLDAPFTATPERLVERMLDLARVGPGDRLIDLGCGDGRIVIAAAKRGAEAHGIDIDKARIAEAKAAAGNAGVGDRVRFTRGDLFAADLAGFDVVTLFLLPNVNVWLEARLRSELAPGARVIGHAYPMPTWPPAAEEEHDHVKLYLWVV